MKSLLRRPFLVSMTCSKHSKDWENSRKLSKPETQSSVCITGENSPNPLALRSGYANTENVFSYSQAATISKDQHDTLTGISTPIIRNEFAKQCFYTVSVPCFNSHDLGHRTLMLICKPGDNAGIKEYKQSQQELARKQS